MNQDVFIEGKKESWETLGSLLDRAKNGEGIKNFTADEVQTLGSLYRRTCSDLSYARSRQYDDDLVKYLNQLARRAYGIIYLADQAKKGQLVRFFVREFPRLIRENFSYITAALVVFLVFTSIGYIADQVDPRYTYMLVPEQFLSIWDQPDTGSSGGFEAQVFPIMAMQYWTNNFKVGMMAFIFGITLGLGTFYMIAYNGIIMGCLASLVIRSHYHIRFFSFIMPHAFIELMAIFICGGAGFMIARAILAPGDLSVRDALSVYGKPAVLLMAGTVTMFFLAGVIEAFISRLPLPLTFKALFGLLTVLLMYLYFKWDVDAGRKKKAAWLKGSDGR